MKSCEISVIDWPIVKSPVSPEDPDHCRVRHSKFDKECDAAILLQIALTAMPRIMSTHRSSATRHDQSYQARPPVPHTLRWYWTLYKQSHHWLGDLSVGLEGYQTRPGCSAEG
jgi:hypothetical protein